jgi:hypothetical protein
MKMPPINPMIAKIVDNQVQKSESVFVIYSTIYSFGLGWASGPVGNPMGNENLTCSAHVRSVFW